MKKKLFHLFRSLFPNIVYYWDKFFLTQRSLLKKYNGHVQIGNPVYLDRDSIELEEFSRIQNDVMITAQRGKGKVIVKKYSAVSARCLLIPGSHIPTVGLPQYLSPLHINDTATTIVIEEDCWVGSNCTLLSKAHVGRGAVVGACSLVTKEIPPYAVVAGSPAKIIAARFNIDQILKHESILYPENERFTRKYLEELFEKYYSSCRTIGTSEISDEDLIVLKEARRKIGIEK